MAELVAVFRSAAAPILPNLQNVDLSDNFLRDRSLKHISHLTKHLNLVSLNLSNVNFTDNLFFECSNEDVQLDLKNLRSFDISNNSLETVDIVRFLRWMDFHKVVKLNVSSNVRKEGGLLQGISGLLEERAGRQLESLDLSRCMIQETELYEFLR